MRVIHISTQTCAKPGHSGEDVHLDQHMTSIQSGWKRLVGSAEGTGRQCGHLQAPFAGFGLDAVAAGDCASLPPRVLIGLAHRWAVDREAIGIVDDAVEMASAKVGSAITSCQASTGSWLVIARQPRLADSGWADEEQIAMLGDPSASGKLLEQPFVKLALAL